jgi:hypothetical protein
MRSATRAGVHIDRAACAWLIRRLVEPEAPGLDVPLRGLSMIGAEEQTVAVSGPLFDGSYEHHRRRALLGREPGLMEESA